MRLRPWKTNTMCGCRLLFLPVVLDRAAPHRGSVPAGTVHHVRVNRERSHPDSISLYHSVSDPRLTCHGLQQECALSLCCTRSALASSLQPRAEIAALQIYPMIGFEWTAGKFFWCALRITPVLCLPPKVHLTASHSMERVAQLMQPIALASMEHDEACLR